MNERTNKITDGHYRIGSTDIRTMSDIRNVDSMKVSVDELLDICVDDIGKDAVLKKLGVETAKPEPKEVKSEKPKAPEKKASKKSE